MNGLTPLARRGAGARSAGARAGARARRVAVAGGERRRREFAAAGGVVGGVGRVRPPRPSSPGCSAASSSSTCARGNWRWRKQLAKLKCRDEVVKQRIGEGAGGAIRLGRTTTSARRQRLLDVREAAPHLLAALLAVRARALQPRTRASSRRQPPLSPPLPPLPAPRRRLVARHAPRNLQHRRRPPLYSNLAPHSELVHFDYSLGLLLLMSI
ncbi:Protein of unknown function [Gryllus bimaculatus]|nr:Protein of unknown function [Gryllus bimaculatus]